jgi:hypothetical protein
LAQFQDGHPYIEQSQNIQQIRAQGMTPYLVAFQIATWYTFDCSRLVRNLDE